MMTSKLYTFKNSAGEVVVDVNTEEYITSPLVYLEGSSELLDLIGVWMMPSGILRTMAKFTNGHDMLVIGDNLVADTSIPALVFDPVAPFKNYAVADTPIYSFICDRKELSGLLEMSVVDRKTYAAIKSNHPQYQVDQYNKV